MAKFFPQNFVFFVTLFLENVANFFKGICSTIRTMAFDIGRVVQRPLKYVIDKFRITAEKPWETALLDVGGPLSCGRDTNGRCLESAAVSYPRFIRTNFYENSKKNRDCRHSKVLINI